MGHTEHFKFETNFCSLTLSPNPKQTRELQARERLSGMTEAVSGVRR